MHGWMDKNHIFSNMVDNKLVFLQQLFLYWRSELGVFPGKLFNIKLDVCQCQFYQTGLLYLKHLV